MERERMEWRSWAGASGMQTPPRGVQSLPRQVREGVPMRTHFFKEGMRDWARSQSWMDPKGGLEKEKQRGTESGPFTMNVVRGRLERGTRLW